VGEFSYAVPYLSSLRSIRMSMSLVDNMLCGFTLDAEECAEELVQAVSHGSPCVVSLVA
jgi:hypothetical protein